MKLHLLKVWLSIFNKEMADNENWNIVKKKEKDNKVQKLPGVTITCSWCKKDFSFAGKDQVYYQSKGFDPPKKCKDCRDKKKQIAAAKQAAEVAQDDQNE